MWICSYHFLKVAGERPRAGERILDWTKTTSELGEGIVKMRKGDGVGWERGRGMRGGGRREGGFISQ